MRTSKPSFGMLCLVILVCSWQISYAQIADFPTRQNEPSQTMMMDSVCNIDTAFIKYRGANFLQFRIKTDCDSFEIRFRSLETVASDTAMVEDSLWTVATGDSSNVRLEGLTPETIYAIQYRHFMDAVDVPWSASIIDSTRCVGPADSVLSTGNLTGSSVTLYADVISEKYEWTLRQQGSAVFRHVETTSDSVNWIHLPGNTAFEWKVRIICNGEYSDYSNTQTFTTGEVSKDTCEEVTDDHMSVNADCESAQIFCSATGKEYHWAIKKHDSYNWTEIKSSSGHYHWKNLHENTKYAYKVKVKCDDGNWSNWSHVYYFTTKYCEDPCETPSSHHISHSAVTYESAQTHCDMDADEYHWAFRKHGSYNWTYKTSQTKHFNWNNLVHNTKYIYKVKVLCKNGKWTGWSYSKHFTTAHYPHTSCSTPSGSKVYSTAVSYTSATTHCAVEGADYHWAFKNHGSSDWKYHSSTKGHYDWTNLHEASKYVYKVKVLCHNGHWTSWSDSYHFTTKQHYNSCHSPKHGDVYSDAITHHSATSHCKVDGTKYHWAFRKKGNWDWSHHTSSKGHYNWSSLHSNTQYEYKVKVECHNGVWTNWSDVYSFKTTHSSYASCHTPSHSQVHHKSVTYNSAITHCDVDAVKYHWAIRKHGNWDWNHYEISSNQVKWSHLVEGSKYEYKVKVQCHDGNWTNWSSTYSFTTQYGSSHTCHAPHHLTSGSISYNTASTYCDVKGQSEYHWAIRKKGTSDWAHFKTAHDYYNWSNLHAGTKYEYKAKVLCHGNIWTDWSSVHTFSTKTQSYGHCHTPSKSQIHSKNVTHNSASTYCDVHGGVEYHWAIKSYYSYNWTHKTTTTHEVNWTNLGEWKKYDVKVKVKCHNGVWTNWSSNYTFTTGKNTGYGTCSTPQSHQVSYSNVTYNSASTHCAVDGNQYHWAIKPYGSSNWQHQTTSTSHHNWSNLGSNTKYDYKVKVACHNGVWTDWSSVYTFTTHHGSGYGSSCASPHGNQYSHSQTAWNIFHIHVYVPYSSWSCAIKAHGTSNWTQHTTYASKMGWGNLKANTKYEYKVKRTCTTGGESNWSEIKTFWTGSSGWSAGRSKEGIPEAIDFETEAIPTLNLNQAPIALNRNIAISSDRPIQSSNLSEDRLNVFPNPANSIVTISGLEIGDQIQLINIHGQVVINESQDIKTIDVSNLPGGYYQLLLIKENGTVEKQKLVVTH